MVAIEILTLKEILEYEEPSIRHRHDLDIKKIEIIGAWGILILMLLFLPIHISDVFSETPAVGSHNAALIRLPVQFLLIFIAWKVKNNISIHKL